MRTAAAFWAVLAAAAAHADPALERAAVLYHKGLYDSALASLESLPSEPLVRSDSAVFYQYAGMACARLGRRAEAEDRFRGLLAIDSLFQFPRNEDAAILSAFASARESLRGSGTAPDAADNESGDEGAGPDADADSLPRTVLRPQAEPAPAPAGPSGPAPGGMPLSAEPAHPGAGIGLAMGAVPLGAGWLLDRHYPAGSLLAFLQAGGIAMSLYASSRIDDLEGGPYGLSDPSRVREARRWQWAQGISLSAAAGAYLYSLIAARRR